MSEGYIFFVGAIFGIVLFNVVHVAVCATMRRLDKKQIRPRFIIYPPGASDEVRAAVDKLVNETWGSK